MSRFFGPNFRTSSEVAFFARIMNLRFINRFARQSQEFSYSCAASLPIIGFWAMLRGKRNELPLTNGT